jgi:hypothetical protein
LTTFHQASSYSGRTLADLPLTSRRRTAKGLAFDSSEAVSSEIAIRLLGPLEVELAGRRVRFEGVKQRKLFMVMAAAVLALPHRPKEAG